MTTRKLIPYICIDFEANTEEGITQYKAIELIKSYYKRKTDNYIEDIIWLLDEFGYVDIGSKTICQNSFKVLMELIHKKNVMIDHYEEELEQLYKRGCIQIKYEC